MKKEVLAKVIATIVLLIMILFSNTIVIAETAEQQEFTIICGASVYEKIIFEDDFTIDDIIAVVAFNRNLFEDNKKSIEIAEIVQLKNFSNKPSAYYITLNNLSYLIINANINNPTIIEYGYGYDSFARYSGVNKSENDSVVYLGDSNFIIMNSEGQKLVSQGSEILQRKLELSTFQNEYSDYIIPESNEFAAKMHRTIKEKIQRIIVKQKNSKSTVEDLILTSAGIQGNTVLQKRISNCYDFIPNSVSSALPLPNNYQANYIYGTTSMFDGLYNSNNHCAAVSAFNLFAYYSAINGAPLNTEMSILLSYGLIHDYIGNGPVTPSSYVSGIQDFIEDYSPNTNYTIHNDLIIGLTWAKYKGYIDNGWMTFMCIWPNLLEAHFINGIGYVITDTTNYCQIIDNWSQPYITGAGLFGLHLKQLRYYQFGKSLYSMGYFYM